MIFIKQGTGSRYAMGRGCAILWAAITALGFSLWHSARAEAANGLHQAVVRFIRANRLRSHRVDDALQQAQALQQKFNRHGYLVIQPNSIFGFASHELIEIHQQASAKSVGIELKEHGRLRYAVARFRAPDGHISASNTYAGERIGRILAADARLKLYQQLMRISEPLTLDRLHSVIMRKGDRVLPHKDSGADQKYRGTTVVYLGTIWDGYSTQTRVIGDHYVPPDPAPRYGSILLSANLWHQSVMPEQASEKDIRRVVVGFLAAQGESAR